jgi:maltokinase-like protein
VADNAGATPTTYMTPVTYRAAPIDDTEDGLIGTSEHGVLGKRWIYDGVHDPVLVASLLALLRGETQAQMQNISDTPDPSVIARPGEAMPRSGSTPELTAQVSRVLAGGGAEAVAGSPRLGHIEVSWDDPHGGKGRATIVVSSAV